MWKYFSVYCACYIRKRIILRFPGFVPFSSYKTGFKMKTNVELRLNDTDNGKPTYNALGTKTCPSNTMSNINPKWTISGSKSGHRLQRLALITVWTPLHINSSEGPHGKHHSETLWMFMTASAQKSSRFYLRTSEEHKFWVPLLPGDKILWGVTQWFVSGTCLNLHSWRR